MSQGINWDLSRRAFGAEGQGQGQGGLAEGDVVELGQWECEISAVLDGGCGSGSGAGALPAAAPAAAIVRRRPLLGRTALLPSVARRGLGSGLGGAGRMLGGRAVAGRGAGPGRASADLRRSVPTGPARADGGGSGGNGSDSDNDSENEETGNALPAVGRADPFLAAKGRRKLLSSGGGGGLRRAGGTGRAVPDPDRTAASATASAPPSSGMEFPGAIGTLAVPPSLGGRLRPHQREGIAFLWNCLTGSSQALREAAGRAGPQRQAAASAVTATARSVSASAPRGAILADEMGLGKTLQTVAAVFALHRRARDARTVVVCPSSLVANWAKEFDKWLGRASQPRRIVVRRGGEEGRRAIRGFVPLKPGGGEVLIVSYELFRMNVSYLRDAEHIGLLAVDEGHRLKNTAGSQTLAALNALRAEARLLLTGTPIQNNLSEFHNVVSFVCPGILGSLPEFRRTYERPIAEANSRAATAEQRALGRAASRSLDRITSTFLLRRLQRDVLKEQLPPRSEVLLFCRPSQRQCDQYMALAGGGSAGGGGGAVGAADALTLLTKVRKLCSHPHLLDAGGGRGGRSIATGGGNSDDRSDVSLSGKLLVLSALLAAVRSEAPTDKVVVVSNFTSALTVIEDGLIKRKGWSSLRLDGTTDQNSRQPLVDSFNRGSAEQSFVFLLSSKAGGCGLNLIGANRLVMFDPDWNPATDQQAMARVYRQGQTKPCYIYRMFTSGTVEEVVYQRQTQKSNLANLTVDCQGTSSRSASGFTKEELRDCFTLKMGCACDTKNKVGRKWDDYGGVSSLEEWGCTDGPLLTIAEQNNTVLSFVRIAEEDQAVDAEAIHASGEVSEDEEDEMFESSSGKKKLSLGRSSFRDDDSFGGGGSDCFTSEEEF